MRASTCHSLAPSTRAASSSSLGMLLSPTRNSIIVVPINRQMLISAIAGNAMPGSTSQPVRHGMRSVWSSWLNRPRVGSYIHIHIWNTMEAGRTTGKYRMVRYNPLKNRLAMRSRTRAAARAMNVLAGT